MQSCYWSIEQLPGLSQQEQIGLQNCGITTTGDLLRKANTPAAKQELANQLQVNLQNVNKWVALADLARIPSVGCEYCGVLLHSGVASASQLRQIPIYKLHRQVLRLQVTTTRRKDLCPSVEVVQKWIQQAKLLSL